MLSPEKAPPFEDDALASPSGCTTNQLADPDWHDGRAGALSALRDVARLVRRRSFTVGAN